MAVPHLPERLGRFEIQTTLGIGAFALVVRAHDPELSSSVAIKILAEHWAGDTQARERFLTEARHLRRVRNPSVVAVHDIGELPDGRPYFVMELADRGALEQRLHQQPAGGVAAAAVGDPSGDPFGLGRLIRGLAEGMEAIHAAGLVHRDLNPRNLLLRSSDGSAPFGDRMEVHEATSVGLAIVRLDERLVIADLGLAKDLIESRELSVVGGSAGYQSPEQTVADGELGPWSDVYASSALLWRILTGESPPAPDDLEARRHELPPEWRPLLRRGLDRDHAARHQTILEWADAALAVLGLDAAPGAEGGAGSVRVSGSPRSDECPYRGLASYEPEHASSFFGREVLITEALDRLRHDRVLAVLGASGSGKSSVVRAGVIPALQAGELAGSERWPVILMTPGSDPLGEMSYQLARAVRAVGVTDLAVVEHGADDPGYAWRLEADSIVDLSGGLVVCVDQFEEIFTHDPDGATAERFIAGLATMLDATVSRVRLVFAMRADFYGEAARHPWLARRLAENQMLVGPMDPAQLRRAITGPATRVGLEVDEGLVDLVLAEVGSDPGSLPLLGHALVETWQRRKGRRLTVDGFREAGGVAGAIAQTAEAVYVGALDEEQRAFTRDLLLRMVTARQGAPHTRRSLPLSEVSDDAESVADGVVDRLVDARLLTIDDTNLQIAHEALITEWPRLRQWIDEGIDDLRLRSHLSRAAVEWRELDEDPAMLYRGMPLVAATEWAARAPGQLGPAERAFLAASDAAAAAERARSAREARRQRVTRGLMVGAVVGLLVVAVVGWAGIQRARAVERSNAAEARLLDNLGLVARLTTDTDPLVGLALGVEARSLTTGPNRDAWLAIVEARRSLATSGIVEAGDIEVGDALSVALSPDGDLAAVGRRSGAIALIDIAEQRTLTTFAAHAGGVASVAFRPDGEALASGGFDETVQVWDVVGGVVADAPRLTLDLGSLVWDVSWSPDGEVLATASEDGQVNLWDADSGAAMGGPLLQSTDMLTVAIDPAGELLVASNGEGSVWGFSLPDGSPAFPVVQAHTSDVWELVFSPDGEEFATSSSDGTVTLRSAVDGSLVAVPFTDSAGAPLASDLRGVQFSADGSGLVVGTSTGEVLWWDRESGTIVAREGPVDGLQVLGSGITEDELVTIGRDQTLRVWRVGFDVPLGVVLPTEDGAFAVAIAPDRSFVATADGSGAVRIHDPVDGRELSSIAVSDSPLRAAAVSPDSAVVAAGTDEGDVAFVDVATSMVTRAAAHDGPVRAVSYDPTGARLATGGKDGTVRIWSVPGGEQTAEFGDYRFEGVEALDWSPDGERLVVVGFDGTADVWAADGARVAGPLVVGDALQSVAFSNDGERITIGGGEETASVWSADLDEQLSGTFATLPGGTQGLAFLDDGALLLAVAGDGTVRLWDLASELPIGPPISSPRGGIRDVAVLDDGPLFATAGEDGGAFLWNVLDLPTACRVIDGVVPRSQPVYLGEGGELMACVADEGQTP